MEARLKHLSMTTPTTTRIIPVHPKKKPEYFYQNSPTPSNFIPSEHMKEKIDELAKLYTELFFCCENYNELHADSKLFSTAIEQIERACEPIRTFRRENPHFTYDMLREIRRMPFKSIVFKLGFLALSK